jgi:hypothetical protein
VCCGGEWVLGSGLQTCAGALLIQSLLPFQELVGWCQLGGLQNVSLEYLRHITPRIGFCLCFYPVLGRSTFSGEFFPIIAQFRGKCKSSQSVPAVEIWLADLDPNDCEEVQTT